MLPPLLESLPPELQAISQHALQSWNQALSEQGLNFEPWPVAIQTEFVRLCGLSDFISSQAIRHPQIFNDLASSGELHRTLAPGETRYQLMQAIADCETVEQLMHNMRLFRNRQQVRIIWRDLSRHSELGETCRDLSALADACIDLAYQWVYQRQCELVGTPIGRHSGQAQQLVIVGMGKLGAYELNLSSDVDLIFAYPEPGETQGAKRSVDNQEFFTRVGQKLIKILDSITLDGFVFRVDMRLRPYGSSGPLVSSFNALEQYYQNQGRDWERYAMIKARVVAGAQNMGAKLLRILRPFVYRRYLDFSAIEALRSMKVLIQQEVRRRDMDDNIKLGSGGIREVEFIAQSFQLIHGGRDLSLQQRPLLNTLDTLAAQGYITAPDVTELKEAYRFLRYLENALQAVNDRQTQMLPDNPTEQLRIAVMMGFDQWSAFREALASNRKRIEKHFRSVVSDPDKDDDVIYGAQWLPIWENTLERDSAIAMISEEGFSQPEQAYERLQALLNSKQVHAMQRMGRERLDAFMPRLLSQISEQTDPDLVLERVLPLIEAIARRSAYLVLLTENPGALLRLLTLCSASPWIASQLTRFPALLDELLNEGRLYSPPLAPELANELRERLLRIPEDDLEQQMNALRNFKLAHRLRVAASEIAGTLPLMKVSDYLTWLAEAVLDQVLHLVWNEMLRKHGRPRRTNGELCDLDFIIIGYGKLGGIELGHGSDLDLVFIYDCDPDAETDGDRPIDGSQFYTRLGQRIISMLTTRTTSGFLYEVDMRLRPSGESGLIASTLQAFERYQATEAWTWEHQALVRARVITGCERLGEEFEQTRLTILGRQRDLEKLRCEVSEMRQRMRENLATKESQGGLLANAFDPQIPFDLKHDAGGIVDIEFIVQYAALAWSWQYPELVTYTDNIRILDALGATHLFTQDDVCTMQEAYKAYRAVSHRLTLQKQASQVSGEQFHNERLSVMRIWRELGLT